jgi:hypothetical protein
LSADVLEIFEANRAMGSAIPAGVDNDPVSAAEVSNAAFALSWAD